MTHRRHLAAVALLVALAIGCASSAPPPGSVVRTPLAFWRCHCGQLYRIDLVEGPEPGAVTLEHVPVTEPALPKVPAPNGQARLHL